MRLSGFGVRGGVQDGSDLFQALAAVGHRDLAARR